MCTDQTFTTRGEEVVLAVSLELAAAKWKVALHDGRRERPAVHTVAQPQAAARLQAVLAVLEQQKLKWSLPAGVRIVVSYEAGQDAFWICRALQARGIECYVIDPASIPVERHKRRAKTDRLDAIKLVINLRAWLRGERDRMHVVHVPSPQGFCCSTTSSTPCRRAPPSGCATVCTAGRSRRPSCSATFH